MLSQRINLFFYIFICLFFIYFLFFSSASECIVLGLLSRRHKQGVSLYVQLCAAALRTLAKSAGGMLGWYSCPPPPWFLPTYHTLLTSCFTPATPPCCCCSRCCCCCCCCVCQYKGVAVRHINLFQMLAATLAPCCCCCCCCCCCLCVGVMLCGTLTCFRCLQPHSAHWQNWQEGKLGCCSR
jgi:hypothetical protein